MKFKTFKQAEMVCSGEAVPVQGVFGAVALSRGVGVYSHCGCAWELPSWVSATEMQPQSKPQGGGHSVLLGHQRKIWFPLVQCLMFTALWLPRTPCAVLVAQCDLWQPWWG